MPLESRHGSNRRLGRAKGRCSQAVPEFKLPALLKNQVQRLELHAQCVCPADLTSDAFLALLLGEVLIFQTFHQSLLELIEEKKLGNYIEIKSYAHLRDNQYVFFL
jgi:hypothetical protein